MMLGIQLNKEHQWEKEEGLTCHWNTVNTISPTIKLPPKLIPIYIIHRFMVVEPGVNMSSMVRLP